MTAKTKTKLSIFTMVLFFIMGVASTASHQTFSDVDKFIPPDFNPDKGILLIQIQPFSRRQNDRMLEFLQKNYPHPYEVVDSSEINNKSGKYADTERYPFAVLWRESESINHSQNSNGTSSNMTEYDLCGHFVDRSTSKVYPETKKRDTYDQYGYEPFFNSIIKRFK